MNISAVSVLNAQNNIKATKKNAVKNSVKGYSANSIQNNSLQEAIGRSQVSFSGTLKNNTNQIHYQQSNLMGSGEDIKYDKTTGQFEFVERFADGAFKKILRISPTVGEEYERNYEKDGSYEESWKFANGDKRIERYNEYQDKLYFEYIYANKARIVEKYDHSEERIIRTSYSPDNKITDIHVLDLTSRTDVASNDDRNITTRTETKSDGTRDEIEYNIVTGFEYSRKTYKGNSLVKGFVNHKETKKCIWRADSVKGKFIEEHLSDYGVLQKRSTTNSGRTEVKHETFDRTGTVVVSLVKEYYGFLGGLKRIEDIDVETEYPIKITTKTKTGDKVDIYNSKTGLKVETSEFDLNGDEKTRTTYYAGTEVPEEYIEFLNCKSSSAPYCDQRVTEFNKKGIPQIVNYFNKDSQPYKIEFLDETGKFIDRIRNYNLTNDTYTETTYYDNGRPAKVVVCDLSDIPISSVTYWESTGEKKIEKVYYDNGDYSKTVYTKEGKRKTETVYTEDHIKLEETEFYDDGKHERYKRIYNDDCSYHEIQFDILGNKEFEGDFYANGSPKINSWNSQSKYSQKGNFYDWEQDGVFGSQKKQPQLQVDEVLDKVSHVVANSNGFSRFDLDEKYWEAFATFLKFATVAEMLKMDEQTYRSLNKQYHPDLHQDCTPEEQKFYEKMTSTIGSIRRQAKKNGIK